ncbi:aldehyde dehydrogenase family protein [Brackiella oedipodis]|uniref:aldehyde dehydrogenase family protein n=1 Tax=Brackiella oedipodis TaxID=124225 RepID=UPI0004921866|nr:aldehyde dehydrogenase family protein [Brackiella oedipodis]
MSELKDLRKFYINGQWVESSNGKDLEVINPSTEESIAVITLGSTEDADKAVAAAKAALPKWSATEPQERLAFVKKIYDAYKQRVGDVAEAVSAEMGAPIKLANTAQAPVGLKHMENFINAFEGFKFVEPLNDKTDDTVVAWEPVGVVAAITPWNWPLNQIFLKIIPAILAGDTVVLKPSEIAPINAMIVAEVIDQAGLPAGVFNLVNGDGAGVGSRLTSHPDVAMVSFTGSTRAGRQITKSAADTIKKVELELGGKGANLVFADAGEEAVKRSVIHCFNNSGQSCNAPTRMLVERSFYDKAIEIAKQVAEQTQVDDAAKEGNHIGPVVSEQQWQKIQDLIQKGIDEGARLVIGGTGKPEGKDKGYFVRPTVFADVNNDMTIARQEIFGPVLSIIPFDSEEEAVQIANDTVYGLTNYIQTRDVDRRRRLSRAVQSGMVETNGKSRADGSAFGGIKESGHAREGGIYGLKSFMNSKFISGWSEASNT